MNDTPAETLYLEDRTDWSPQPRWRTDRRGALTVLAALGVFVALLGVSGRREARASTRTAVARKYSVVRLHRARATEVPRLVRENPGRYRDDCSPLPTR